MKLSREIVLVISLFLTSLLQIHCTLGRGLSTPEERAKARHIARLLEQDPLAKDAPANRQWLLNWMIEVPDIHFKSCVDLLRPDVGNQYRYSSRSKSTDHVLCCVVQVGTSGASQKRHWRIHSWSRRSAARL